MGGANQGFSILMLLGCALMAGCSDSDRQEVEKMKTKTKNSIFDKPFDTKLNEQNMEEMKKAELKHTAEVEKIKEAEERGPSLNPNGVSRGGLRHLR